MRRAWQLLVLTGGLMGIGTAWSAPAQGCGVFSIDRLIAQSQRVKLAQIQLLQELAPRVADLTARHQHIRQLELVLHNAAASGAVDRRAELEAELASSQASFAADKDAYQNDKVQRTREVLAKLLVDVGPFYRAIGVQRGFARLYQDGVPEPVFPPAEGTLDGPCAEKVDLTDEVVQAFDKGP